MPSSILSLPISRTLNLTLALGSAEGQDLVYTAMPRGSGAHTQVAKVGHRHARGALHCRALAAADLGSGRCATPLGTLSEAFSVVDSSLEIPSAPMCLGWWFIW